MTTTTAATPGAVTSLLGQQGQAGTAQAGQVDVQGIFDSILKNLPDIVRVVQGVVSGQSAGPQGFTPQSYGSYGGMQAQNVDPMGLFDSIFKQLPNIIRVVQGVVAGQSAGPQGFQPQTNGGSQPQSVDPQFLQFLLPALPALISTVGQLIRPQQAGPQGFQPQMFGGTQPQQLDPQGFFDNFIKQLPNIIQVVQGVVSGQSADPQSIFGRPYTGYPGYTGYTGWPGYQPTRPMQPMS
jgi:hypothetical protein